MLFSSGLEHGGAPELWNVEHPERVAAVHQAYLDAGSRILLTNTFGGSRYRLVLHKMEDRVAEFNRAAVKILRGVVDASGKNALVAGDIGPSGGLIQPLGDLTYEEVVQSFAEQAAALVESGVDVIWIETMAALEEVQAAVEAVRQGFQRYSCDHHHDFRYSRAHDDGRDARAGDHCFKFIWSISSGRQLRQRSGRNHRGCAENAGDCTRGDPGCQGECRHPRAGEG